MTANFKPPHTPSVSDARLASVLDIAADGIIVIDEAGRVLLFNRACERLFGYMASEIIGRHAGVLVRRAAASNKDVLADGAFDQKFVAELCAAVGSNREVAALHRSGYKFPIEVSIGEAQTPEGRQFVGILRDLRPRKEAEDRLNRLQADFLHIARISAMDEMGAALAHELNQPLTAILLYLQTILRGQGGEDARPGLPPASVAILGKAVYEAERAGKIIQRMRNFAEKRESFRRPFSMRLLIDEALELTLIGNRDAVHIVRTELENLPPVLVDGVQIQQILVNLLRNAIEAVRGRQRAEIRIASRAEDNHILVKISDNGPGIAADVWPKLFKVFTTTKTNGLGVGLAISKTIAQNHGGDLLCEPGGRGEGARFTLRLPIPTDLGALTPADADARGVSESGHG